MVYARISIYRNISINRNPGADSIRRFDSKTNRTADSIRDSIRTKKTIRRSLEETTATPHNNPILILQYTWFELTASLLLCFGLFLFFVFFYFTFFSSPTDALEGVVVYLVTTTPQIYQNVPVNKIILKIGQYMAKIWTKVGSLLLWVTMYIIYHIHRNSHQYRLKRILVNPLCSLKKFMSQYIHTKSRQSISLQYRA